MPLTEVTSVGEQRAQAQRDSQVLTELEQQGYDPETLSNMSRNELQALVDQSTQFNRAVVNPHAATAVGGPGYDDVPLTDVTSVGEQRQQQEVNAQISSYLMGQGYSEEKLLEMSSEEQRALAVKHGAAVQSGHEKAVEGVNAQISSYLMGQGYSEEKLLEMSPEEKRALAVKHGAAVQSGQEKAAEGVNAQVSSYLMGQGYSEEKLLEMSPEEKRALAVKHGAAVQSGHEKAQEGVAQRAQEQAQILQADLLDAHDNRASKTRAQPVDVPGAGTLDPNQPFDQEKYERAVIQARTDPALDAKVKAYAESYGHERFNLPESQQGQRRLGLLKGLGYTAAASSAATGVGVIGAGLGAAINPVVSAALPHGKEGALTFTRADLKRAPEAAGTGLVHGAFGGLAGKGGLVVAKAIPKTKALLEGTNFAKNTPAWKVNLARKLTGTGAEGAGGAAYDVGVGLAPDKQGRIRLDRGDLLDIGLGAASGPVIDFGAPIAKRTAKDAARIALPTKLTIPGGGRTVTLPGKAGKTITIPQSVGLPGGFVEGATPARHVPHLMVPKGPEGLALRQGVFDQIARTGEFHGTFGKSNISFQPGRLSQALHQANPEASLLFSGTPVSNIISTGPEAIKKPGLGAAEQHFFVSGADVNPKFMVSAAFGGGGEKPGIHVFTQADAEAVGSSFVPVRQADGSVKYYKGGYEIEQGIPSGQIIPPSERFTGVGSPLTGGLYLGGSVQAPSTIQRQLANVKALADVGSHRGEFVVDKASPEARAAVADRIETEMGTAGNTFDQMVERGEATPEGKGAHMASTFDQISQRIESEQRALEQARADAEADATSGRPGGGPGDTRPGLGRPDPRGPVITRGVARPVGDASKGGSGDEDLRHESEPRTEPPRVDPPRVTTEPPRVEPPRPVVEPPPRVDPPRVTTDPPRVEPPRPVVEPPPRVEPPRPVVEPPPRVEPPRVTTDPPRVEPEPAKVEPEPARVDPARVDPEPPAERPVGGATTPADRPPPATAQPTERLGGGGETPSERIPTAGDAKRTDIITTGGDHRITTGGNHRITTGGGGSTGSGGGGETTTKRPPHLPRPPKDESLFDEEVDPSGRLHPKEVEFETVRRHTVDPQTGEITSEPVGQSNLDTLQVTEHSPRVTEGEQAVAGNTHLRIQNGRVTADSLPQRVVPEGAVDAPPAAPEGQDVFYTRELHEIDYVDDTHRVTQLDDQGQPIAGRQPQVAGKTDPAGVGWKGRKSGTYGASPTPAPLSGATEKVKGWVGRLKQGGDTDDRDLLPASQTLASSKPTSSDLASLGIRPASETLGGDSFGGTTNAGAGMNKKPGTKWGSSKRRDDRVSSPKLGPLVVTMKYR